MKAARSFLQGGVLLAIVFLIAMGATRATDRLVPLAALQGLVPSAARAALSPDGRLLVLNNVVKGSLMALDLEAKPVREVKSPGLGRLEFNIPVYLTSYPSGFLLLADARLLWFTPQLQAEAGWILPNRTEPPGALEVTGDRGSFEEVALWEANALDSRTAIAFGDFLDAKGWRKGVAKLRPKGNGGLRLDLLASEMAVAGAPTPYYLFPLNLKPSLAIAGREVYQLRFGKTATLERLLPTPRSIPLPKPFDAPLPLLGRLGGRENQPLLFARLGATPLPRAIHAWKGSVYLATASPRPKGEVDFALWRWDEKAGWRGPLAIEAPPEARELAFAPGPNGMVVLFKKAIVKPEEQELIGFRLLKAATILGGLR